MQIGAYRWESLPIFLAPMEDVTDTPFRQICIQFGADAVFTEFISVEGIIHQARKTLKKAQIFEQERPIAIQIFGSDADSMRKATRLLNELRPDWIDINFGCPAYKVVCQGAGAAILKDPDKMEYLTATVRENTSFPVTVKTRLGWDEKSIYIDQVALRLQRVGISALTVHLRTKAQGYKGQAQWHYLAHLKALPHLTIPIIGNGDIQTPQQAAQWIENYQPDGIMIGRAAIGYPWIFREIKTYLQTGKLLPPPTLEERLEVCEKHLRLSLAWKETPYQAVVEHRKYYSGYFKGLPHFKSWRMKLMQATTPDEVFFTLEEIRKTYDAYMALSATAAMERNPD
ncbi:MAG: tRNA dihydrouridine synthase DusB [Bacteroidia bacterium]